MNGNLCFKVKICLLPRLAQSADRRTKTGYHYKFTSTVTATVVIRSWYLLEEPGHEGNCSETRENPEKQRSLAVHKHKIGETHSPTTGTSATEPATGGARERGGDSATNDKFLGLPPTRCTDALCAVTSRVHYTTTDSGGLGSRVSW